MKINSSTTFHIKSKGIQRIVLLFILFIGIFIQPLYAQSEIIQRRDSLQNSLALAKDDTTKANIYLMLADFQNQTNPDPEVYKENTLKAIELAKKANWDKGLSEAYYKLGHYYFKTSPNPPKALENFFLSMKHSRKNKSTTLYVFKAYSMIISIYIMEKEYDIAFKYANEAIKESEKESPYIQGLALSFVADIYKQQGEHKKAAEYYQKAVDKMQQDTTPLKNKAIQLNMSAAVVGSLVAAGESPELINGYITQIENALEKAPNESKPFLYNTIINAYTSTAKHYSSYNQRKKYLEKAKYYIEKSSNDKDAIARDSSIIINNYVFAYEVYKMEGNFEKSLENLEKLTSSYTHIFTRENQNKITTLELKQQEEKHEYELQLSAERLKNKENEIKMYYISIILSTIILVMLVIFIYKQKKNNKQLQILNKDLTESNSVKNQILGIINHDLRQPVASLIGFLQIKNVLSSDDVSSDEMLKLNKQAMQMTENLLFSMEDLLQWSKNIMSNYSLSLSTFKVSKLYEELKIFFNNNDKITFNYNSDFEITTEFNYLKTILRNLISNSLKASESENPQKVLCQISASEGRICFKVSNNGPEMSQKVIDSLIGNRLDYSSSDGLGLRLIYDLSQAINGKISVSQQEGQTTVELSIDNQSC